MSTVTPKSGPRQASHDVSDTQAYKLIAITEHLSRERAVELGQEKPALVQLATATPERDTAKPPTCA